MYSLGSTVSTLAKEVYIKKYKKLKFRIEFKLRSSRCEHPARTSTTDVHCDDARDIYHYSNEPVRCNGSKVE